MSEEKLQKKK